MKKIINTLLIIAALCAVLVDVSSAETSSYKPTQTTSLNPWGGFYGPYLTVNFGDDYKNVGLMKFDLSSFTGTVQSASLSLYHLWNTDSGANFGVYQVISSWSSSTLSLSDMPTLGLLSTSQMISGTPATWVDFDVTAIVNSWVSGSVANEGLMLMRNDQVNPLYYFTSQDGTDSGQAIYAPVLTLTYGSQENPVTPVPEPSTYGFMGAAGLLGVAALRRRKASKA